MYKTYHNIILNETILGVVSG